MVLQLRGVELVVFDIENSDVRGQGRLVRIRIGVCPLVILNSVLSNLVRL